MRRFWLPGKNHATFVLHAAKKVDIGSQESRLAARCSSGRLMCAPRTRRSYRGDGDINMCVNEARNISDSQEKQSSWSDGESVP